MKQIKMQGMESGDMAQQVKCWLCKHENPSLTSHHSHMELGIAMEWCAYNLVLWK